MTNFWRFCYILTATWLPKSRRCVLIKWWRSWVAKHILHSMGKNVNIEKCATFNQYVSIGDNSGIGVHCELNGCKDGEIEIGDNVMMGPEVVMYTRNHCTRNTEVPMNLQGYDTPSSITIGSDVWIGRRVIILPGVTIGNGVVIGSGAVVTKDIPDYAVAVGVPACVKKYRIQGNQNEIK